MHGLAVYMKEGLPFAQDLSLESSVEALVSVSIDFPSNSKWDALFYCIVYYSCADRDGLQDHLRYVPWEDIFKLSASAAASEFYK